MNVSLTKKILSLSLVSQKKLESILSECGDKKDLIIDPTLIEPFDRVCRASWLRLQGVDKIYKFEPQLNGSDVNKVYLIPSCLIKLKYVLDQINGWLSHNIISDKCLINIVIFPKSLTVYETLLEEEGLYGIAKLRSYQWELILLDEGILSLELPFIFKNVFVNKNTALLSSISNSLWTLFHIVGKPNLFVTLGKQSAGIVEILDILSQSFDQGVKENIDCDFGALLLIDRDQDYSSSLLTPGTYSGLLYEIFIIKCGKVSLDVDNTKHKQGQLNIESKYKKVDKSSTKPSVMVLDNDSDAIYSEIRYRHFSTVFSILSAKAKVLNSEGSNISDLEFNQMKQYVSTKLQCMIAMKRSLANHLLACETIVATLGDKFEDIQVTERSMLQNRNKKSNLSFIEENLCTDTNMYSSLRMLCLLTLTQGISTEEYNSYITKFLHGFGYKYLYIFQNLISAGILIPPSGGKLQLGLPNLAAISERLPRWQNNFQTAANKLKQLPNQGDDITMNDPTCPSYVFSGSYVPLVAAVARILLTCDNSTDLIAKLSVISDVKVGGSVFDNCKKPVDELGEKLSQMHSDASSCSNDIDIACKDLKMATNDFKSARCSVIPLRPKALLVFVVGGVTQAEAAACRLIEKLTGGKIVVASDSVITGESLMQAAM